ncbi:hypothetical protein MTO96_000535 [Rhipicephalus appendiculatus]
MKPLSAIATVKHAISTNVYGTSAVAPPRVFFLDHALQWFPSVRVLAADGLHPNFEGVALLARHIKQLCFRNATDASSSSWLDHMPSGTMKQASDAYQRTPVQLASSPRAPSPRRLPVPEPSTEPRAQQTLPTPQLLLNQGIKDAHHQKGLEAFLCLTGTL